MGKYVVVVWLALHACVINSASSHCNGHSCWSVVNQSRTGISINCIGYGDANFFSVNNLFPGERYARQYDEGWGDGLGFPEPNSWFSCFITTNSHKKATMSFSTIGWGDSVKFFVTGSEVLLRQRGYGSEVEKSVTLIPQIPK